LLRECKYHANANVIVNYRKTNVNF
jgi:hypothetical protein